MIIDFDYIVKRIEFLIEESQKTQSVAKQPLLSWKIKKIIPSWIKMPFKTVFSWFKQMKQNNELKKQVQIPFLHPLAINFMKYFFVENQRPHFDTSIYFEKNQDREIIDFIDNRIVCVIANMQQKQKTEIQKNDIQDQKLLYRKVTKDKDGLYHLNLKDRHEYILPVKNFATDVFIHHYGLKTLSNEQKKYIENKDFLDIGAFCGDTSLVFFNYNPHRIYAYEPVRETFDLLLKTVQINEKEKIVPINKGVGERHDAVTIYTDTSNLACSSIVYVQGTKIAQTNIVAEQIEIVTIDDECKDRKVGLIKMDIEGFEYYAIKGGLKTIQRDKPILLISIYHTAKDFFEIPPMLREICPDYKFKYVDIYPSQPVADKIIIAYI
jgi:FkbM family methyltransferase